MMAAILNSAMLDSDTAILESDDLLSSLRLTQKHSHSILTLTQNWFNLTQTHSFSLNLMMAAILNSAILDSSILQKNSDSKLVQSDSNSFILTQLDDGSHLEFCHHGLSHFAQKNFTDSFLLNLMMAAILNSAMLDSDTAILESDDLLSSLRLTQKHSHSILTLTQTDSIWLKLIHSHLTWWWQPSWIWPYWIQPR